MILIRYLREQVNKTLFTLNTKGCITLSTTQLTVLAKSIYLAQGCEVLL